MQHRAAISATAELLFSLRCFI